MKNIGLQPQENQYSTVKIIPAVQPWIQFIDAASVRFGRKEIESLRKHNTENFIKGSDIHRCNQSKAGVCLFSKSTTDAPTEYDPFSKIMFFPW